MTVAFCKYGVFAAVLLGGTWSSAALSGDWSHEARLSLQGSHETNPQLDNNRRKVTLGQVVPTWVSNYDGETFAANTAIGATVVRSSDQVAQSNSVRFDTQTSVEAAFEKLKVTGNLNYFRRDFQNTEFNDDELTTDASNASVSEDITVDDVAVQTRFETDFTSNIAGFADNNFRTVKFSGGDSTDFTNDTLLTGAILIVNDRLTVSPSIGYTRFEPENTDPTNLYRVQIGGNYSASDTVLFGLTIGGIKTDTENDVSLDATYQQEFLSFTLDASASRDLAPSDGGELRKEKAIEIGVSHDFSDYTRIRVDAEWQINDDVEARRTGFNLTHDLTQDTSIGVRLNYVRSYRDLVAGEQVTTALRADPFFVWRISEQVDARLSYREVQQDQTGADRVRTRRVAFVLNYSTPFD